MLMMLCALRFAGVSRAGQIVVAHALCLSPAFISLELLSFALRFGTVAIGVDDIDLFRAKAVDIQVDMHSQR